MRMFQVPPSRFHCHLLMCFEMLKHIPEVIIHPTTFYDKARIKFCQSKHPSVKYLQSQIYDFYQCALPKLELPPTGGTQRQRRRGLLLPLINYRLDEQHLEL